VKNRFLPTTESRIPKIGSGNSNGHIFACQGYTKEAGTFTVPASVHER